MIKISNKEELIRVFDDIREEEIANDMKPVIKREDNLFSYLFGDIHFVFINNVTIAFNKVQFDEDNLRFYIDDKAVGAIAILNIDNIAN